jgi:hypothetical protein
MRSVDSLVALAKSNGYQPGAHNSDTTTQLTGEGYSISQPDPDGSTTVPPGVAPTAFIGETASNLVKSGVIGLGSTTATQGSNSVTAVPGTSLLLTTLYTIVANGVP